MNAATFDQPNVVSKLCLALLKLQDRDFVSSRILAQYVAPAFANVPLSLLQVYAAAVLRLHFDPIDIPDMHKARLDASEVAEACEFLGGALAAEAAALRASFPGPDGRKNNGTHANKQAPLRPSRWRKVLMVS